LRDREEERIRRIPEEKGRKAVRRKQSVLVGGWSRPASKGIIQRGGQFKEEKGARERRGKC